MNFNDLIKTSPGIEKPAASRASRKTSATASVGGVPFVSLLPIEILDATSFQATKRALVIAVVGVALISGSVIGGTALTASTARARLDAASSDLVALNAQVAKFSDLQKEQQEVALGTAAADVGGSTSVDWQAQIASIEAVMPSSFSITGVTAVSAAPGLPFEQSADPLDPPRVATMTITAKASEITELPQWVRALRSLKSYASVVPVATATDDASSGGYTVVLSLSLNKFAFVAASSGSKS